MDHKNTRETWASIISDEDLFLPSKPDIGRSRWNFLCKSWQTMSIYLLLKSLNTA